MEVSKTKADAKAETISVKKETKDPSQSYRDRKSSNSGEVPIKRKRENFKPVVSYSQPEYLEGLDDDVVEMPYDDYVQDLEVGVVYNNIDTRMGELRETEFFTLYRDAISLFVVVLCVGGIFLVFIGRAETAAFQSQPRLIALEIIGYLCCIPIIFWAMFWLCPSRKERSERKKISRFRKVRLEPYSEAQVTEVKESKLQTDMKQFAKRREEYLIEERRIQAMKENKRKGLPTGREVDRFNL